jgi:hypothetical protein
LPYVLPPEEFSLIITEFFPMYALTKFRQA